MLNYIYDVYRFFFARKALYKFNKLLFNCALRGMGIFNYENSNVSGEYSFLKNFLINRKNCTIFDIGANIGNYSRMIKTLSPMANIYAFEPHPKTYQKLITVAQQFGFSSFNLGCGEKNTQIQLYDYADEDGSSHASLYSDVITHIHKRKMISHDIEIVMLDDFVKKNDIKYIDLLKIDAEGNDFFVLKGLERTIANGLIECIHFEFNEMNVVSRIYFRDFFNLLEDYDLFRMLPNSLVEINSYSPIFCEIFAYQNIIAIKKIKSNS